MRRSVLIYNPLSGRQGAGQRIPKLVAELERGGFAVEARPTERAGDGTRLAAEAAAGGDGLEAVFAVGGDGTLREVAAGLLGSEVALGALPEGTANVLAYELRQPRSSLAAARALAGAEVRTIDVGMAGKIPFLMMASGGIDAAVMAQQSSVMKRLFGVAAVGAKGLRVFLSYDSPMMELRVGGDTVRAAFFSACNIPFFGGPVRLAPEAEPRDGILDLVLLETPGRWALAKFFLAVLLGRHLERPDVRYLRVRELEILGPLPFGLQVDGDVLPVPLPCRVTVRREALRVLVPPHRS